MNDVVIECSCEGGIVIAEVDELPAIKIDVTAPEKLIVLINPSVRISRSAAAAQTRAAKLTIE